MVQLASFLNRSLTDEFSPVFEIIYASEDAFLVCNLLVLPMVAWIVINAVPLHRNLRYMLFHAVVIGWMGVIARAVLLAGQSFNEGQIEWGSTLAAASYARRFFFAYFGVLLFGITIERLVATVSWSWYEKQENYTLVVLLWITLLLSITAALFSYRETFGETAKSEYAPIIFTIFSTFFMAGNIGYILLVVYNVREVAKLSQRGADQYSLGRTYQLRENVAIMKMLLRLGIPMGISCIPIFIFLGSFIFLPSDFIFLRLFSMGLFDLWTAVVTLTASIIFPLAEPRFRRPAFRLPFYRLFMPSRIQSQLGENIAKEDRQVATEHHFDWLNRDLM